MAKVQFGMCWEEYGIQTVDLPEEVDRNDKEAIKNYLESIWDEIPLPEGDYVTSSDRMDLEFMEILEDEKEGKRNGKGN